MSSQACRLLKIFHFETFKPGLFVKAILAQKRGFSELKITLLVLYHPKMPVQKRPWFKYFELMFLIIQDVHQLISTNGSLGSIHDP